MLAWFMWWCVQMQAVAALRFDVFSQPELITPTLEKLVATSAEANVTNATNASNASI